MFGTGAGSVSGLGGLGRRALLAHAAPPRLLTRLRYSMAPC